MGIPRDVVIDGVGKIFEGIADVLKGVEQLPIVYQVHYPDVPGQGKIIPANAGGPTELAQIPLQAGNYLLLTRFNLEVSDWAPEQTRAKARTVLSAETEENVWDRIEFVINGPRSTVASHLLGVRLNKPGTASVRVIGDFFSELLATGIVLAGLPLAHLQLTSLRR
jgi:hypothetical protein